MGPTALISYSHDSPEHERAVLALCNRLRARGIDTFVDQFLAGAPSEGWPLWMERQIEQRDFTLMVCTESYQRRFMEIEAHGIGRGVVWEARILRNLLYEDAQRHGRIIPVLLQSDNAAFVPMIFRGHYYDLSETRGFESLLRHLLQEPDADAGALGSLGPQGSRWSAFERPWLVPDAMRTRYFIGRGEILARLRQQLAERHRAALSGLGGIGKTQTALEYAVRNRAEYPDGVFWVNAETIGGLTSGFVEIANELRLAAAASNDQEQIVRAVLEWFNGNHSWLLIVDNVEEPDDVAPFLPLRGDGHILITSRETVFQKLGMARGLEVGDLGNDEALQFLFARTGRSDAGRQEQDAATELSLELGNLPLALEQAAAYIAETNAAFVDYLSAFRKRRLALLEKAGGLLSHDTVAVTWAANFEAVERASPAAAEVLRISAFLAPDAIPFEMFSKGAQALGDIVAVALPDAGDVLAMGDLLRPLTRYSLIRSDAQSRAYSIHRVVQEIVRSAMSVPEERAYVQQAVGALDAAFPEVEYATWPQCERLVPHVAAITRRVDADGAAAGRVLNHAGRYLRDRGRYAQAREVLERALAIRERSLEPDHPDIAQTANNLGVLHWDHGSYAEANTLFEYALAIRERALGSDHPDVAASLNNLANVHYEQGRFAEAQPLLERALAVRERAHGPDHTEVAHSLNNLACLHGEHGRYAEAQALLERSLAIQERALGPDHPDLGFSLNGLGEAHAKQGRYAEAQALFDRALAIRERALGPHHSDLGYSLNGLGIVHCDQGRYAEAQVLHERALAIFERAFGPDHPLVAMSLSNLASIHHNQSSYAEAEPLFKRALSIRERALGPNNVLVAETIVGLALLRVKQGRAAEAVALYERALAIKERTFAADHPELAEVRAKVAELRAGTTHKTAAQVDTAPEI